MKYGADENSNVSPAPVGVVKWAAKKRGTNEVFIVAAHSWYEGRIIAATKFRCEPGEVDVEIEKEQ